MEKKRRSIFEMVKKKKGENFFFPFFFFFFFFFSFFFVKVLVLVLLVCFGAAQEQGHVLAGLGAGVKGSAVFVASAEMMRGEGASFLLEAARMQVSPQKTKKETTSCFVPRARVFFAFFCFFFFIIFFSLFFFCFEGPRATLQGAL